MAYEPPQWSTAPTLDYSLEVVKDGSVVDKIPLRKPFLIVGRQEDCDLPLMHLSVSRKHAALQFGESSELYLCDLGSTHGTTLNKERIPPRTFKPVPVGSTIVFGSSSRKFVVQGPEEMEPQEQETERLRRVREQSEARQDRKRKERAERKRSRPNGGASWGMADDAPEEDEAEQESRDFLTKTIQSQESGRGSSGGPELSEGERAVINRLIRARQRKRQLEEEVARIQAKRGSQQGELVPGQWEQLERHETALEKLEIDMEELEEEFQDLRRAKSRRGKDYRRNMDVRDDMEAEAVEFTGNAWDNNSDDEEEEGEEDDGGGLGDVLGEEDVGMHLRDRARGTRGRGTGAAASAGGRKFTIVTGRSKSKHVVPAGGARSVAVPTRKKQAKPSEHWTAASLEARLKLLEQEKFSLEETIARGESASEPQPAAPEDDLDAFLEEADREQQVGAAKQARESLALLEEEVNRLTRLHELARPALEGLESRADRELRLWLQKRSASSSHEAPSQGTKKEPEAVAEEKKVAKTITVAPVVDAKPAEIASVDAITTEPPSAPVRANSPPRPVKRPRAGDTASPSGRAAAAPAQPPPKRHRAAAVEPAEDVVTWQPPKGQRGDGRTSLNDALGY